MIFQNYCDVFENNPTEATKIMYLFVNSEFTLLLVFANLQFAVKCLSTKVSAFCLTCHTEDPYEMVKA